MTTYAPTPDDSMLLRLAAGQVRAHGATHTAVRLDELADRLDKASPCGHQYILSITKSFSCTRPAGHPSAHEQYFDNGDVVIRWGLND